MSSSGSSRAAINRSGRTRTARTWCRLAQSAKPLSTHLQRQRPGVLGATVQTNKSCLEGVENSQVTGGQHGDRIDSDAERQPLMTRKERIKRLVPLRRIDGRLGHHLTDQRVPPFVSQRALMDLGRWQDPAAADESPEFAGQVEAGKEQVPCRCGDPVRRHDQCAKTARNLDHFPHDWRAFDLICVKDGVRGLSSQN